MPGMKVGFAPRVCFVLVCCCCCWRPRGLVLLARVELAGLSGWSLLVSRVLADLRRPSLENWVFSPPMEPYGVLVRLPSM